MAKKGLLVLIIAVLVTGGVFAQSNTVTVDVGPTIACFAIGPLSSVVGGLLTADSITNIKTGGFGIAAQYEHHLIRQLSVAGRVVYGAPNGEFDYKVASYSGTPKLSLTSLAGEGHVRFYPLGDTFFLDGMVGYAWLSAHASGTFVVGSGSRSGKASESGSYLKYGAKLGWRMSFGRNGGFTFEPSVGWYLGTALGDALAKKITTSLAESLSVSDSELSDVEKAFSTMEKSLLIGGPRVSLAFGYRF
jgi:hypothetical protein